MNTQTEIKCPYCKDNYWIKTDGDEYECYKCGFKRQMDIDIFLKDILAHEDKDKRETIKWVIGGIIFIILTLSFVYWGTYNGSVHKIRIDGDSVGE